MKLIYRFFLLSLLFFHLVNGEDFHNGLSTSSILSSVINSLIINNPPSTKILKGNITETRTTIPNFFVLGFKKISFENGIIFYVFTRVISKAPPTILDLKAEVQTSNNLGSPEEISFRCFLPNDYDIKKAEIGQYTFICTGDQENVLEVIVNLDSIKIDEQKLEYGPSAELTNNLNKNTELSNLIENKEIIIMKECKIDENDEMVVIEGIIDDIDIINQKDPYLLIPDKNNNKIKKIPCYYKNLGDNKYELILDQKIPFGADLDKQMGRINDKQSILLNFADEKNAEVDYSPFDGYNNKIKKRTIGLSTGGIIAITIPSVALLLAFSGLAFILGKRKPSPPVESIGNNMIRNNSSSALSIK